MILLFRFAMVLPKAWSSLRYRCSEKRRNSPRNSWIRIPQISHPIVQRLTSMSTVKTPKSFCNSEKYQAILGYVICSAHLRHRWEKTACTSTVSLLRACFLINEFASLDQCSESVFEKISFKTAFYSKLMKKASSRNGQW